jgi:hypothetical protein
METVKGGMWGASWGWEICLGKKNGKEKSRYGRVVSSRTRDAW